jgi:hypothetical protein
MRRPELYYVTLANLKYRFPDMSCLRHVPGFSCDDGGLLQWIGFGPQMSMSSRINEGPLSKTRFWGSNVAFGWRTTATCVCGEPTRYSLIGHFGHSEK